MRRLDLVVGPNGAGKSTFVRLTLAPLLRESAFVNADEIAKRRWPADPEVHAYEAARIARDTRSRLIELGRPFIAETVFSHPSKLGVIRAAKAADYIVFLHALIVPEDLSVARVAHRVMSGGHSVPENKIRGRYQRLWPLVADAIALADNATVYDNASREGPQVTLRTNEGVVVGSVCWPPWAPGPLRARWPE